MSRDIEKYTKDYNESTFEHIQVRYRVKKVLEILEKYASKHVLEIGCGNDSVFNHYKNYLTATVVEPSVEFANKCKNDFCNDNQVNVICDFFENVVLKDQHFDFIILSCLLHEVEKPEHLLRCICTICDTDTVVHINVPNSRAFHLVWAYESGLIPRLGELTPTSKKLQQNTSFDMTKLSNMILSAGLQPIESGSYFVKPFNHEKMSKLLEENVIDQNLLDGLYSITKYMPDLGSEIYINAKRK